MPTEYVNLISQEVQDYKSKDIEVVPGLFFSQKRTIDKIYFYWNSKFEVGTYDEYGNCIDEEGDKKYFYNVVKAPCQVTTKFIDFDTKNIKVLTAGGGDPLKTWYFERDLKFWMKDQNFGKILNRIFRELPIFGSVVLKIINNKPYFVDLRNFVVVPNADSLDESSYIMERHLYTTNGLRKIGKEMGWKNIEETIQQFNNQTKKPRYIEVFERYGEVAEQEKDGNWKITNRRTFWANVGEDILNHRGEVESPKQGVLLKDEEYKGHPYYEFHMEKIPGRWLGVGVVEALFDPQIRQNEIANQEAKGTYYASLRLWQSSGDAVGQNFAMEAVNGQVIDNGGEPILPIDMTERNLSYFIDQTRKWLNNRDELSSSYDTPRGERSPSGTTLGEVQILASSAMNHFGQIQETVALDVKEMLLNEVIPAFEKENSAEHVLRLVGEDLDTVRQLIIQEKANSSLFDYIKRNNKLPGSFEFEAMKLAIEQNVEQDKELLLTIPKDFYKGLKYKIDIDITGESVDTRTKSAARFAILQAITADPTVMQDPSKRKLLIAWAEENGINISDIEKPKQNDIQQLAGMRGSGGGVSRPNLATAPVPGEQTATL